MAIELHHLHPSHDDELTRLKARIAELERMDTEHTLQIAELKADYQEACDRLQTANLIKDEQLAATRHHKYKRCLAMARWCASRSASWCLDPADEQLHKSEFYDRWEKHWKNLVEKFK